MLLNGADSHDAGQRVFRDYRFYQSLLSKNPDKRQVKASVRSTGLPCNLRKLLRF